MRVFTPVQGLIVVLLAWMLAFPALVQAQQASSPTAAEAELDLQALMQASSVFKSDIKDAIWRFTPGPGKKLVQIPVKVVPGKAEYTLDSRTISLRGGRFVAWYVKDDLEKSSKDKTGNNEEYASELSEDVPRFSRSVTVTPKGRMRWDLERRIFGGEIVGDKPYAMKIDSQKLNAKSPGEPPKLKYNDPGAAAAAAAYREKADAFRELRSEVLDLPSEFEDRLPERIWAIYELNSFTDSFEFDGEAPLPWEISFEQLEAARQFNQPLKLESPKDAMGPQLSEQVLENLGRLQALVATEHPYNIRLATYAVSASDMSKYAQVNGPIYALLQSILTSKEQPMRRVIAKELVSLIPPTPASRQLLTVAAQDLMKDAALQRERLKGLLRLDASSPVLLQETVAAASSILADPNGPDPRLVIEDLIAAAHLQPDAMSLFANGVQFGALTGTRRDIVIADILERAGSEPLAAHWLSTKLLGSSDVRLVHRTLEVLNAADTGSAIVRDSMNKMVGMFFSGPRQTDDKIIRAQINAPIPIDSSQHSIFRALQHGDNSIRNMAWQALPLFAIPATGKKSAANTPMMGTEVDRYQLLVEVALAQQTTPMQVVDFLVRQPDVARSTDGLVKVMLKGTDRAAVRAARALLGSGRPIDKILLDMSWGDRHGFARQMYSHLTRTSPAVTGLLRERTQASQVTRWFGQEVARGQLPAAREWIAGAGGEEKIYELVVSSDPDLSLAAIAALVGSAGQDDRVAQKIFRQFQDASDRSVVAFRDQWNQVKRKLYVSSLQREQGIYKATLFVSQPGEVMASDLQQMRMTAQSVINLPNVELIVRDDQLSLSNVVALSVLDTRLAVVIDQVSQIKGLAPESLRKLPLETVAESADLSKDGEMWRARFLLPDRRTVVLVLEPANGF